MIVRSLLHRIWRYASSLRLSGFDKDEDKDEDKDKARLISALCLAKAVKQSYRVGAPATLQLPNHQRLEQRRMATAIQIMQDAGPPSLSLYVTSFANEVAISREEMRILSIPYWGA